jgi:hypothetical protein
MSRVPDDVSVRVAEAVAHFWRTRQGQAARQKSLGHSDQGARGAVTGGAQMDGFIGLFTELIVATKLDGTEDCGIMFSVRGGLR